MEKKKSRLDIFKIVFVAVMSAVVFVITFIRVPVMGTYLHLANGICMLAALLFGKFYGGLAAGLGSGIYDLVAGYGVEMFVTMFNKFMMAFVCGAIAYSGGSRGENHKKNILGAFAGAMTYVVLFLIRTLVLQRYIIGLTWEGTFTFLIGVLAPTLINAGLSTALAPALNAGVRPALKQAGILEKLK